uniref:Uncharacterized protein n=1 Tax=Oryza meridionalis TaxID=40149 RepID=A0A0E0CR67_9ORYZ
MAKMFVLPLMAAVLMLLVVSGSARPLGDGDKWAGVATSGDHSVIQFLKHLYLQQLADSGPSCNTNDQNIPPCHP